MISDFTYVAVAEYFEYLDDLRDSGRTNMFGAGIYLQSDFELSRKEAASVLRAWMDTFDGDATAEDRARAAIARAEDSHV